ncbi:yos1-like protein [Lasallia pustulata]|uniref:Yos1-like protein n=1 Tax=Lasallia pustulata TaxID=136370 RepID=A0A1W5DAD2_9LECA|nr:yos1-like protein [Lasallia pustulata]
MMLFGLGNLFYVSILLVNAIAILSEDRFLARIGWGNTQQSEPGFGASNDTASVKAKIVNLIASVRTLMRSMLLFLSRAGV